MRRGVPGVRPAEARAVAIHAGVPARAADRARVGWLTLVDQPDLPRVLHQPRLRPHIEPLDTRDRYVDAVLRPMHISLAMLSLLRPRASLQNTWNSR